MAHALQEHIRIRPIRIDDGRRIARQQRVEEAQLCRRIGFGRAVIVEMIAAEIGEARRIEAHAVEAALVDAVRGRLHGKARDAIVRQTVEALVQGDRIGRRQRAVGCAVRRDDAERADARRLVAQMREELAREIGDRALAARSGDGDDFVRLLRIEARGGERQTSGARRSPAHRRHDRAGPRVAAASPTTATAPAATACGTKLMPSTFVPGTAKNRVPVLDLAAVGCDLRNGKRGLLPAPRFDDQIAEMLGGLAHRLLPQAPRRDISGKGCAGGSKRGGTPSSGATRSITLPVTGPAFQPAVEKP